MLQEMLEGELDDHIGYEKYEHNGESEFNSCNRYWRMAGCFSNGLTNSILPDMFGLLSIEAYFDEMHKESMECDRTDIQLIAGVCTHLNRRMLNGTHG